MPTVSIAPAEASTAELLARFRPVFDRIAEGAAERDRTRHRPHEQVDLLKQARFGALRLPTAEGGFGATIEQEHILLLELGAADSNLPQIWRNHFAFVEDVLFDDEAGRNEQWRARIAAGALFGGAWSEAGGRSFFDMTTTLTRTDGGAVLDGTKFYSTGSLFADWISVLASGPDAGDVSLVLIEANAAGVTLVDDWDGVGQRLAGSGTTTFDAVAVPEGLVPVRSARAVSGSGVSTESSGDPRRHLPRSAARHDGRGPLAVAQLPAGTRGRAA